MRTTVIRTMAAAVLLSAALTIAGCSTSLQGPANPTDTPTTSYGPPVATSSIAPTTSGSADTSGTATSGAATSGASTSTTGTGA